MIIKFCLVFPKIFILHKVVRDAKKVEKHCINRSLNYINFVFSVFCSSSVSFLEVDLAFLLDQVNVIFVYLQLGCLGNSKNC